MAPADGLLLEALERDDGVDEAHLQRLVRAVLAAEKPDLLGLLGADEAGEQSGAEAAVERADLRAGLAEHRVVGGDGEVADEVQHVAAANGETGDLGDDRLGQPAHLDVQVGDVEAPDAGRAGGVRHLVAGVAADVLIAAGAEGVRALAGEDDHADLGVLASALERVGDLDQRLGPEGVADLRAVDGDLGDAVAAQLVADVGVVALRGPRHGHARPQATFRGALLVPSWLHRSPRHASLLEAAACARVECEPGQRVAIAVPPGPDFEVLLHAVWLRGGVAVPHDLRLTPAERPPADVVIEGLERGPAATPRTALDLGAPALGLQTSGSTGAPKPVTLTFGNLLWSALGSAAALGVDPADRWLSTLPLSHVGGLSILVRSAIYGTEAVIHERFEADRVLHALAQERITAISLVPTTLARLLEAGLRSPPHLRFALLGGAPIPPVLLARATEAGVRVVPTYGLTETASQVTTDGWPLFCTRVTLAADGEILVRGPTVASVGIHSADHRRPRALGARRAAGDHRTQGRHDRHRR